MLGKKGLTARKSIKISITLIIVTDLCYLISQHYYIRQEAKGFCHLATLLLLLSAT